MPGEIAKMAIQRNADDHPWERSMKLKLIKMAAAAFSALALSSVAMADPLCSVGDRAEVQWKQNGIQRE